MRIVALELVVSLLLSYVCRDRGVRGGGTREERGGQAVKYRGKHHRGAWKRSVIGSARLEYTPITRNAIGYRSALSATGWALTHIGVRLLKITKENLFHQLKVTSYSRTSVYSRVGRELSKLETEFTFVTYMYISIHW